MTWGLWGIGLPDRPVVAGLNGDLPEGLEITTERHPHGESSWHAHHDGYEVGTLWVEPSIYGDEGKVSHIEVDDDYRRRGVGTALWEAAGRPLHTPGQQSPDGQAWAEAVGGGDDYTHQPGAAGYIDEDEEDEDDYYEDEDEDDR